MKVTHYEFGHISIDGDDFDSDVIITPDIVHENWWRKQGHNLVIEDLDAVVAEKPETVVIGSGYYGQMQVPENIREYLEARGIKVVVAKTSEAVEKFNELQKKYARIVAALHLTC